MHVHKGESRLFHPWLQERSDERCSRVLSVEVITNDSRNSKDGHFEKGENSQCLREVLRTFHFSNEGWVKDLSNEQESDVLQSTESKRGLSHCV